MLFNHRRIFRVTELYGTIVIMDTQKNDNECKIASFRESPWVPLLIKPCREVTPKPSSTLKVTLDFIENELDERLIIQFEDHVSLINFFKILGHLKNEIC